MRRVVGKENEKGGGSDGSNFRLTTDQAGV